MNTGGRVIPYTQLVNQFAAAPPGKLYCVHGATNGVFRLSLYLASRALLAGVPVALVDGTNRFDVYYIAEIARRITTRSPSGVRVTPEELLARIHVSRAFTCYQMEATITDRLPAFLRRSGAPVAVIFGLLDTFYDDQAPMFEVKAGVRRVLAALHRLKRDNISVLLASRDTKLASRERNALFPAVSAEMDHLYALIEQESGYRVVCESKEHRSLIGAGRKRGGRDG